MTCVSPHNSLTPGASCPQPQVGHTEPSWQVSGSWRIGDAWQRHNVYLKYPPMVSLGLKTTCRNTLLLLLSHFSWTPTLCDPIDGSPPGSPIPGILQARTLEWIAIFFSNAWKWKVKVKSFSCVWLFTTPWIAAHQAPLSMGFSRQEYWSGVPLPSPAKIH